MRLNDPLVTDFFYDNQHYEIDLSFDNVLDVYDVLENKDLFDHEKLGICLDLLIGENTWKREDGLALWNYIFDHFIKQQDDDTRLFDVLGNPIPQKRQRKFLDLEKDGARIYASFLQAYKINLYNCHGELSWQEFRALLEALPEDTILQQIVKIRRWKPSKHESNEYKNQMRNLQRKYSLNECESEYDDEEVEDFG